MNLSPIILFVYNRPEHTRRTIEALQKNDLAIESNLIIFSDGYKNELDKVNVQKVREYLKTIAGFKDVQIIERAENWGLARSIIAGVTGVVNQYGRVIVLEDDLVTSPYFLQFMNSALDMYEDEELVISISGYVYPVKGDLPETFFIKTAECWGWATWKRGWEIFESDSRKLLKEIVNRKLMNEFDFSNSIKYVKMLKDQVGGRIDSWAIRWYASAFLKDKLTLFPGRSLVQNIGFDFTGRHCSSTTVFDTILTDRINLQKIPVVKDKKARREFINYFRSINRKNLLAKISPVKIIRFISKKLIQKYGL